MKRPKGRFFSYFSSQHCWQVVDMFICTTDIKFVILEYE